MKRLIVLASLFTFILCSASSIAMADMTTLPPGFVKREGADYIWKCTGKTLPAGIYNGRLASYAQREIIITPGERNSTYVIEIGIDDGRGHPTTFYHQWGATLHGREHFTRRTFFLNDGGQFLIRGYNAIHPDTGREHTFYRGEFKSSGNKYICKKY
jgi:hypothetical protein